MRTFHRPGRKSLEPVYDPSTKVDMTMKNLLMIVALFGLLGLTGCAHDVSCCRDRCGPECHCCVDCHDTCGCPDCPNGK